MVDAVDHYAATGEGDVGRLQGRQREWRLRVGDVRVAFTLDPTTRQVRVLSVSQRGDAYR